MNSFNFVDFYKEAMDIFIEAGHATSSDPYYFNHSAKQVIYFDTCKRLLIDNAQIHDLECAIYISHLFDIGDNVFSVKTGGKVSYYSIAIQCEKNSRSQIAYKAHMLLHPAFEADMSIILFKHDETLMLSILGYESDIILSDWYSIDTEYDILIERLHISNLSISSAREFVSDLCYSIARSYYFQSIDGNNYIYSLLPDKYFLEADTSDFTTSITETIKEIIRDAITAPEKKYGDDFIEPISLSFEEVGDIDIELEKLGLELEDGNEEEFDDDSDVFENEDEFVKDEYEFGDVDPELFKDASRLAKWLEKNKVTI